MNWFQRTFHSKKQEVRGKKKEAPAFSSYFLLLTSYFKFLLTSHSKFRLVTPVLLAVRRGSPLALSVVVRQAHHTSGTTLSGSLFEGGSRSVEGLALFTSFLIRLRRIPRIFTSYLCTAKIRGAVRYFFKRRNIEQSDSAARQRMTPMSMAKFFWIFLSKESRIILPYLASRGNPGATGSMIHTAAVLSSPQDFITGGSGSPLLS